MDVCRFTYVPSKCNYADVLSKTTIEMGTRRAIYQDLLY